jgi:hypothetical protein
MLLLDSGRSSREAGAVSVTDTVADAVADAASDIVDEIAELQRENSALVAELRRQRRRRRVKRLRRFSFVVVPIARTVARRFAKNSTAETPATPTPPGSDRRVLLIILALVIRRIMVSSAEPTSAKAASPLTTSSEVPS